MRAVGLKILKNKLSARLANAMLEEARRKGLITPALNPSESILPGDPVMTFGELMRDLEDSRQDR